MTSHKYTILKITLILSSQLKLLIINRNRIFKIYCYNTTTFILFQDMLGLDEEARMNYPSHADSNWQWRLNANQMKEMKEVALPELNKLTETYGRGN